MISPALLPLRRQFIELQRAHLQQLNSLILSQDEDDDGRDVLYQIGDIAHKIAGVAAVFGFVDLGTTALAVDRVIVSLRRDQISADMAWVNLQDCLSKMIFCVEDVALLP